MREIESERGGGKRRDPAADIANEIDRLICEGVFPAGQSLPSERELSKRFNASRGVIREVLQIIEDRGLLVREPKHRPVVTLSGRLTAITPRNLCIWLWPNSKHYVSASILQGIQSSDIAKQNQLVVSGVPTEDWDAVLASEAEFLESAAADPNTLGIIIWYLGGERNAPSVQKVMDRNKPMVFIDRLPPQGIDVDYVGTNNFDSARYAVQHLMNLGHRRIAMVSNIDPASSVDEREQGYRRALQEQEIQLRDEWIQRATYDEEESVRAALESMCATADSPPAIFCINDHLALQVHAILQSLGAMIPNNVSVIGFDGLLRWVPGGGHITTMHQEFDEIGRIAANLIQRRVEEKGSKTVRHTLLNALLKKGPSTGPAPAIPFHIRHQSDAVRNPVIGD